MKPEKIVLPVDVRNCPLEAFPLVDRLASKPGAELTLLHVVTLNILAPESRIYDELVAEADAHLKRLCREFLPSVSAPTKRVRFGKVVEEILAEVHAEKADLVVIPTHGPSFRERLRAVWHPASHAVTSGGVKRIMREARCAICIAAGRDRFDCEREWGRPRVAADEPRGAAAKSSAAWDSVSMVVSRKRFKLKHS